MNPIVLLIGASFIALVIFVFFQIIEPMYNDKPLFPYFKGVDKTLLELGEAKEATEILEVKEEINKEVEKQNQLREGK